MPTLAFLLVLSLAEAHRPHAVLTSVTGSQGSHWALLDPHDVSQLMVSEDGGQHWNHVATPAMESALVSATLDAEDRLHLLAADGSHFWEEEDGTWGQASLPTSPLAANHSAALGGGVLFATSNGIYRYIAGSTDTFAPSFIVVSRINVSCDTLCSVLAVGASGGLWRVADLALDGVWEDVPELVPLQALPGGRLALSGLESEGLIFAGTDAGVLRSQDEGLSWENCGALPTSLSGEHSEAVPALFLGEPGTLLAGSGHEALFVSTDQCESWTSLPSGLEVAYGGTGNATDPAQAWVHLSLEGSTGLVAGFGGARTTTDGGSTWQPSTLLRNRYTRAVALSSDWPEEPRIFAAGYGGGISWSADGGETWDGSATGLDPEVVAYDLLSVPGAPDVLLYAGLSALFRSNDSGAHWEPVSVPMARSRAVRAVGETLYLLGEDVSQGMAPVLARSLDQGRTWSKIPGFGVAVGSALPRHLFGATWGGVAVLVAVTDVPAGIWVSTDSGDTWEALAVLESEPAAGGAVVDTEDGSRVVFATPTGGVELLEEEETEWRPPSAAPTGSPRRLVAAEDGTLWLATRGGTLWKSADGGDSWSQVGDRLPSAIHDLVPVPESPDTVLLATQLGTWWTDGGSIEPLPWMERLENGGVFLTCGDQRDECESYAEEGQGAGGGVALEAGESLHFSTEATQISLLVGGDAEWEVWVDGEQAAMNETALSLDEGWKDLEVRVTSGSLQLDAVEAWGEGTPLPVSLDTGTRDTNGTPPETPKDKSRCNGCTSGTTHTPPWALLLLLGSTLLRRQNSRR